MELRREGSDAPRGGGRGFISPGRRACARAASRPRAAPDCMRRGRRARTGQVPEFEELQISDLFVSVIAALGKQTVAEKTPVLIHKELLAAVDVDQHGDDVSRPPAMVAATRWSVNWVWLPVLPVFKHLRVLLKTVLKLKTSALG